MKKLIFSIAALAAIVVMGSCSKDSDLTNKTAESVGNVTVSLNVNSGIEVSGSSSSMDKSTVNSTKTLTTRVGETTVTTPDPFTVDLSSYKYTAYFVAAEAAGDYKAGDLVRKVTVTGGANSISVPAIKYNIYVTNYDPTTITPATGSNQEDAIKNIENQLPESSTSILYLFGSQSDADFSNTTDATKNAATVKLNNHYAAVCIAANDFVNSVSYKQTTTDKSRACVTSYGNNNTWFYMYINTSVTKMPNSTIALQKISGTQSYALNKKFDQKSNPLVADNVYMFTVNDDYTGGGTTGGATLTVSTDVFKQTKSSNLSVY